MNEVEQDNTLKQSENDNLTDEHVNSSEDDEIEIIKSLLHPKLDVNDFINKHEWSKLFSLLSNEGIETIIKLFLENGMNIDARDKNDDTALLAATKMGNDDIVWFLLEHKADVDVQDKNGLESIYYAVVQDNDKVIECLTERDPWGKTQDKDGNTALHIAAIREDYDVMSRLVHRSDLLVRNNEGNSVLDIIYENKDLYFMDELRDKLYDILINYR